MKGGPGYGNAFGFTDTLCGEKVDSPHKGTVMRTFYIFCDLRPKKMLNKQSNCRLFVAPWRSCYTLCGVCGCGGYLLWAIIFWTEGKCKLRCHCLKYCQLHHTAFIWTTGMFIHLHTKAWGNMSAHQTILTTKMNVVDKRVFTRFELTHCGRVTHICVGNLAIIGSDNGLSPDRCQAIIWTNDGILLIGPLGTNFSEILIKIQTFSLKEIR